MCESYNLIDIVQELYRIAAVSFLEFTLIFRYVGETWTGILLAFHHAQSEPFFWNPEKNCIDLMQMDCKFDVRTL